MEEFDDPLMLFKDALPNHLTRDRYEHRLDLFFKFLEIDGDSLEIRAENFTKKSKENPNWTTSVILKYIRMHKERAEKKEISKNPSDFLHDIIRTKIDKKYKQKSIFVTFVRAIDDDEPFEDDSKKTKSRPKSKE